MVYEIGNTAGDGAGEIVLIIGEQNVIGGVINEGSFDKASGAVSMFNNVRIIAAGKCDILEKTD